MGSTADLIAVVLIVNVPKRQRNYVANVIQGVVDEIRSLKPIRVNGLFPDLRKARIYVIFSHPKAFLDVHRVYPSQKWQPLYPTLERLPFS
jgi:hypothetical protein